MNIDESFHQDMDIGAAGIFPRQWIISTIKIYINKKLIHKHQRVQDPPPQ
jgi:hypothetical protein